MPTYFIDEIDFRHPVTPGTDDLQYPLYRKLIDYNIVTDKVREALQIEPAFQFLDPEDEDYEFVLTLDDPKWRFAKEGGKAACKETVKRGVDAKPVLDATLENTRRTCRVRLAPKDWGLVPEVIVLRIFCNRFADPEADYDPRNGVSLTLVNPGGKPMNGARANPRTPVFNLEVTGFQKIGTHDTPIYRIFESASPLAGASIEPVFRVSTARPNADVRVVLQHPQLTFPDPLSVFTRDNSGSRPPELSKLKATNPKELEFSWTGGTMPAPKKFGFHVPVLISPLPQKEPDWVAQPPKRWTYVDPILFHDPPSG